MNHAAAERIPGMIEPLEQLLLYRLAAGTELLQGDILVELGTLFGRSTNCLAQGLLANKTCLPEHHISAYDNFRCDAAGFLGPEVIALAERGGVGGLLRRDGPKLDFRPVFDHYLKPYIDRGLIAAVQAELAESLPPLSGNIALMHIDSPKFYEEFKPVLFRFLPRTRTGAVLVFQDFLYQWSATLIAAVSLLINRGLLKPQRSIATSLVATVETVPSAEDLSEIDLMMSQPRDIPQFIQEAIDICRAVEIDRPEIFMPRLHLAKFQHLWECGRYGDAAEAISAFFNAGNQLNAAVVNDFMEMLAHGFSVRRLYERDRIKS